MSKIGLHMCDVAKGALTVSIAPLFPKNARFCQVLETAIANDGNALAFASPELR